MREDGDWSARVLQADRSRAQEGRRREHAEARCALVEGRCREAVRRLELELARARRQAEGSQRGGQASVLRSSRSFCCDSPEQHPSPNGGAAGAGSSCAAASVSSLREELQAVRAQLEKERALHKQHIALYHRYLPDLAAACGTSPPPAEVLQHDGYDVSGCIAHAEGGDSVLPEADSPTLDSFQSGGHTTPTISDDEDYAWEGYLEWAAGDGHEKVFLELSRSLLRVSRDRGAPTALCSYALDSLAGPAEAVIGRARCFEVPRRGTAAPQQFRCVSERRAAQWIEAINRAWRRNCGRGGGGQADICASVRSAPSSRGRQSEPSVQQAPVPVAVASPPLTPPVQMRALLAR